jgi:hypothetical protein
LQFRAWTHECHSLENRLRDEINDAARQIKLNLKCNRFTNTCELRCSEPRQYRKRVQIEGAFLDPMYK